MPTAVINYGGSDQQPAVIALGAQGIGLQEPSAGASPTLGVVEPVALSVGGFTVRQHRLRGGEPGLPVAGSDAQLLHRAGPTRRPGARQASQRRRCHGGQVRLREREKPAPQSGQMLAHQHTVVG